MKQIELKQGSQEWLAHRANHFNASDAPAMMGVSSYKTRNQLMHELHTGLPEEVNAETQKRFDDGHKFEAIARPLAEQIIGEELYPVVGVNGKFSASFDGITLDDGTIWEHKTLNERLDKAFSVMQVDADAPHCQFLDSDGDIKDCALLNVHNCRMKAMKAGFDDCVDDLAFKAI